MRNLNLGRFNSAQNRLRSPPCAATIASKQTSAEPSARCSRHMAPASSRAIPFSSETIFAASSIERSVISDSLETSTSPQSFEPRMASASATSFILPTAKPRGASIRVTRAHALRPAAREPVTSESASALASSKVFMKAPLPHFTSKTSVCAPSASFFDRIDAVIRGIDATVPVTSLSA